jgi:hypothetical protein
MSKGHRAPKSKAKKLIPRPKDAAAYNELVTGIQAAVKPIDTIDELFVADVTAFQWEVQRFRRLKFALLRIWQCAALKEFLADRLHLPSLRGRLCGRARGNPRGQSSGRPSG